MSMKNSMLDIMSEYLSKSDIYAAEAIAKISAFIIQYRHTAGMTQKEFAKMMDVTQAMVSKWESASYNFTIETIAKISEKLNCTFEIEFNSENEYLSKYAQNVSNTSISQSKKRNSSVSNSYYIAA